MSLSKFFGKKHGMTTIFSKEGDALPVTVIEMFTLTVTQVKTLDNDGYDAVQLGFVNAKHKHLTHPQVNHLEKNNLPLFRNLKEVRFNHSIVAEFSIGDKINPFNENSFIEVGKKIKISGKSIGKGFQGNTKRWGHSRGLMSHGSKSHRLPGSIGAGTTPGRVFKGLQMAGNMGNKKVTVAGVTVIKVIENNNLLLVKGPVPGVEGGLLEIRQTPVTWNNTKIVKKEAV
ncbi:MAG: 50S ribosomal protein L3 [Cyanobacteria bacterium P01_H01_bin.74]